MPGRLEMPLLVATPLGRTVEVSVVYRGCEVHVMEHDLVADLILLEMLDFDSILGMDWLARHHATLDCRRKEVTFHILETPEFSFQGERSAASLSIISSMQAARLLRKGREAVTNQIRES